MSFYVISYQIINERYLEYTV